MKKFLALVMAMMMVLAMGTAFADETVDTTNWMSAAATYSEVIKTYTVTGGDTLPAEKLMFTSTADGNNPDNTNLTIDDIMVDVKKTEQVLTIQVPKYSKVGVYKYTISETAGTTQGVVYTDEKIAVTVLVEYDYDNNCLKQTTAITRVDEDKDHELTNEYNMGTLAVSKKVTGNLGDKTKEFTVTVTFKAENNKTVLSAISYVDGTESKTIPSDWTGTKSVDITLKHGETVTFKDIPAGVTYTVEEDDYTTGEKNGENGYDAAEYKFSDSGEVKVIGKSDTDTVEITNNKSTEVDTGINMDNAPYMMIMALVVLAGVAMMMKRRAYND